VPPTYLNLGGCEDSIASIFLYLPCQPNLGACYIIINGRLTQGSNFHIIKTFEKLSYLPVITSTRAGFAKFNPIQFRSHDFRILAMAQLLSLVLLALSTHVVYHQQKAAFPCSGTLVILRTNLGTQTLPTTILQLMEILNLQFRNTKVVETDRQLEVFGHAKILRLTFPLLYVSSPICGPAAMLGLTLCSIHSVQLRWT
jgi:hypothetical protein